MPISFEVKETDLMGRIGVLRAGSKSIETPCLLPVIHPVTRDIPISKFSEMGFRALMTNSLIFYRRQREEAIREGIHRLLGYDGILMTDSGGYQVLEYGETDVTPSAIARFQSEIGSDLAVTLDRPTGYSRSRKYAKETMETSLRSAVETIEGFKSSSTTWVGPIQGGLFPRLVRRSAKELVASGFEMVALGSPVELMENYLFVELVEMIAEARRSVPYSLPMHLFGAGHPLTLPLSVALGCDTFDSASYVLFAKQGRYMTERGTLSLEEMGYLPCSCPACNATSRTDLLLMERDERVRLLALHNLYLLRQEVLRCKQAIFEGRLWDLVEERASAHPRVQAAFEALAKRGRWLAVATPRMKERGLLVRSPLDEARPELANAAASLRGAVRRGTRSAILVCSPQDKPLSRTGFYRRLVKEASDGGKAVYKLHANLGPYPAELEFVYPFTQTVSQNDVPPRRVAEAVAALKRQGYRNVRVYRGGGFRTDQTKNR